MAINSKKLKELIKLSIQQYFQESGISKILIQVYKNSKSVSQPVQENSRIKNLLNTQKHLNQSRGSKTITNNTNNPSGVSKLRQKYPNDNLGKLIDAQNEIQTPDLILDQNRPGRLQTDRSAQNRVLNENLQANQSILQLGDELPAFLKRNLKKFQSKSK